MFPVTIQVSSITSLSTSKQNAAFETVYKANDKFWERKVKEMDSSFTTVHFNVGNETNCDQKEIGNLCNGPLLAIFSNSAPIKH